MCVTRTAESVVLTLCPPGPEERNTSMRRSAGLIWMSTSSASGSTATGHGRGVDAPLALGGRHALHAVHAALVLEAVEDLLARHRAITSLTPPASDSEIESGSTFQPRRSA
jgi:hypothetical protein